MPQPRREQIKDLLTKHSLFSYVPTDGNSSDVVLDVDVNPYMISAVPGGVQESIPAMVLGTISEPFNAMFGNSFTININGASTTVAFAGTDTTASKVALAINTAVVQTVATNDGGYLRISNLVIPNINNSSTMILTDGGGFPLTKFGISGAPTTYYGYVAPVRGIVTTSLDGLGGVVHIKTTDGKNVVTDAGYLSQIATASTSPFFVRKSDVLGGIPIHGRILRNSANTGYNIAYYAMMETEPEVISANSDFASLDAFDSVNLTFSAGSTVIGPIAVDFPIGLPDPGAGGYTRDLVVDRINKVLSTLASDNVTVVGTVCQPFGFIAGGESFTLSVNGVSQSFNLLPTDTTYTSIAAKILAAIPVGITVTGPIENGNIYISITCAKVVGGVEPSLEFIGSNWLKLGFSPGLYKGFCFAEGYGSSEIKIRGIGRGSNAIISVVGGGLNTLARLGITAGMRRGNDDGEQKVNFPNILATGSGSGVSINCLIPEVLEFGEVDPAIDSIVAQFNNKSAGSNQEGSWLGIADNSAYGNSKGIENAGKPVIANLYGTIDLPLLRPAYDEARRTFSRFIRGSFDLGNNAVNALVTNVIETTGTGGNPLSTSATFTIDVDPSNAHALRDFKVEMARDTGGVIIPFRVKNNTIALTNTTYSVELSATTGIYGAGTLTFSDANTVALANTPNTIWLSDNRDSKYIRVFDKYANNAHTPVVTSLLQKMNSIWTATVGDGTNSFGDFNGTDAIQQAITYWTDNVGLNGLRIQCKAGVFEVNIANHAIALAGGLIIIDGLGADTTTITVTDATSPMISVVSLILNDLTVSSTFAATDGLVRVSGSLKARKVAFKHARIMMTGPQSTTCVLEDCHFSTYHTPCATIYVMDGSTGNGPYTFRDCEFNSATDFPVLSVEADNAATPLSVVDNILFDNCIMNLSSTTISVGCLKGNCGVIDIVTNGSCYTTGTGIEINEIKWRDCVVNANVGLSGISTLIHLIPTDNKVTVADLTTNFAKIRNVIIDGGKWMSPSIITSYNPFTILGVDNVTIKSVELGFLAQADFNYGGATKDSQYWCDGVGGVTPTTEWGAFALYASEKLTIKDVKFTNLTRHGSIGDLFIRYSYLDIDGIDMTSMYVGGAAGVTPDQRIRFRPAVDDDLHGGRISNLLFNVGNVGAGQVHAFMVIGYEPSENNIVFDNIRIMNAGDAGLTSGSYAFYVYDLSLGELYAGSTNLLGNLTISNSRFSRNRAGIACTSSHNGGTVSNINVINNTIDGNYEGGIAFMIANVNPLLGSVSIKNNIVYDCGSSGYPGVAVLASNWTTAYANVSNNIVHSNNALATGTQIEVGCTVEGGTEVINQVPKATMIGNSTRHISDIGKIKSNITSAPLGTGIIALTSPATRAEIPVYGIETSRDAAADHFVFANGARCMFNDAILETP
jgi:hypothetical protein